jgi:hypothetical protein
MSRKTDPTHLEEILWEDFMEPLGLSSAELARKLHVPANRISQVLQGKRNVSVDTALRLECFFLVSAHTWLNLQQRYDLEMGENTLLSEIRKAVKPNRKAA